MSYAVPSLFLRLMLHMSPHPKQSLFLHYNSLLGLCPQKCDNHRDDLLPSSLNVCPGDLAKDLWELPSFLKLPPFPGENHNVTWLLRASAPQIVKLAPKLFRLLAPVSS